MKKATMSTTSTVAGLALAAIMASNVDWTKLFSGDKLEASKLAGGGILALLGWLNQKQASDVPKPEEIATKTDQGNSK